MSEHNKSIHMLTESDETPSEDTLAFIYHTIQKLNEELQGEVTITDVNIRFSKPVKKYTIDINI